MTAAPPPPAAPAVSPASDERRAACRRLLALACAPAAALAGAAQAASAASAPPIAPQRVRDYIRMRGGLDEGLEVGWLSGTYHGVVDGEITPLFGVQACTFSRYRELPGGGWRMASFEHAYYTDLASGEVLPTWLNPYNGKTCQVPVWSSPPSAHIFTAQGHFETPAGLPPGAQLEHVLVGVEQRGDELIAVERVRSAMAFRPPPAPPYRYSEVVTLRARSAALAEAAPRGQISQVSMSSISGWRPWMQMSDAPGHLMAHGVGGHRARYEELPAVWRAAAERQPPAWLKDPGQRLQALLDGGGRP